MKKMARLVEISDEEWEKIQNWKKKCQTIDQSWSPEQIARECPPPTWERVFEYAIPEIKAASKILLETEQTHGMSYPLRKDFFQAFSVTPLPSVKVVLVGQDPYHQTRFDGLPRAQGLSFSVSRQDDIPSSLSNIFTELANTIPDFVRPLHGDLTSWARQGVLLLNMSLTVKPHTARFYEELWMGFISKVLEVLAQERPHTVYILLGRQAQKLQQLLPGNAQVVTANHPSGLSAHRGFFGKKVFPKTNRMLEKFRETPIDWNLY